MKICKFLIVFLITLFFLLCFIFATYKQKPQNDNSTTSELIQNNLRLESFYTNKADYEQAFEKATTGNQQKVIAGITSHHFLAKSLIAQFFAGIALESIENIIIVGPDHFYYLLDKEHQVVTSKRTWNTLYGAIYSKRSLIDSLVLESEIEIDDTLFLTEHSIYTLVPFAKKVFADATIAPIVIGTNYSYVDSYNLGRRVSQIVDLDTTLLVISSDFSHEVLPEMAGLNDEKSKQAINNLHLENISSIECDCKPCMAFLAGYLEEEERYFFKVVDNKTSNDFGEIQSRVTSYISGYFVKVKKELD